LHLKKNWTPNNNSNSPGSILKNFGTKYTYTVSIQQHLLLLKKINNRVPAEALLWCSH